MVLEDVVNHDVEAALSTLKPDFIFSFYCRRILPDRMLRMASRAAVNLHGSLLPKYRGRCPVNWVLIEGEDETGVTLHHMVSQVDAGDIVGQHNVTIDYHDTIKTLFAKMEAAAADLFDDCLPALLNDTAVRTPQDMSQSTYFGGRRPEDGRIDWFQTSKQVYNLVRAVTHPYPGAFSESHGNPFFIWQVEECGAERNLVPGEVCHVGDQVWMGTGTTPVWLRHISWAGKEYRDADVKHCELLIDGECIAWE